ncbi:MAG: hypothetical protein LBU10_01130 [Endomicrobium sp.]|jgi:DNA-binding phage protein|nr:hypothetical protein [Endomicrobium sp.]
MKKTEQQSEEITPEDARILKEDFFEHYANRLKKDPEELAGYKKYLIDQYNKDEDLALFLEGLKIVAKAERKIQVLAKAAKVERTSVYRMLSKGNNISFNSFVTFIKTLGYKVSFSLAHK